MKSIFKRSAIAAAVLGLTSASYAAMPNNNTMWSPHMTGWFIGVDALDLRPENGDLDYVTLFPATSNGSFYTRAISTDYDWSWRLYGGIKFTDNDDITLSWMRMRTSDSDSVAPTGAINNQSYSVPRWLLGNYWENVAAKVKFDLDEVYGVWGHTINFNNPWSIRYAAGIEYAKLDSDFSVSASDYNNTNQSLGYTAESRLHGWGPRVEFDMTYHLPYGFALFANTNAALLVSTRKIELEGFDEFNYETDVGYRAYSSYYSNRHVVVPKLGMRLGASYTYMFGQAGGEGAPCSSLTIDAGWQVESYIHAIERPEYGYASYVQDGSDLVQPSSYSGFASTKTSNFGDQGLFLGIKFSSDWM
ncbi:hypothetical protein AQUSIP_04160 [Aquicella siphonis]|uniref:Outer membrane protein beta-barrel domain-containing protein n=1 Tax=Aquicella siphonis TaxID=254247 RepID=A0A5E4PDV3_9COXI|nr:Lpg1974 family pore-forming outer membrane protein [Aquicella siphonis]VVC75139.1 hypothetical protein AQUSIP_04160 [Aquicella siphonis]